MAIETIDTTVSNGGAASAFDELYLNEPASVTSPEEGAKGGDPATEKASEPSEFALPDVEEPETSEEDAQKPEPVPEEDGEKVAQTEEKEPPAPLKLKEMLSKHRFDPKEADWLRGQVYTRQQYERLMPLAEAQEIRELAPTIEDVRNGAAAAAIIQRSTHDFVNDPAAFAANLRQTDERAYKELVKAIAPQFEQVDPQEAARRQRTTLASTISTLASASDEETYRLLVGKWGHAKAGELIESSRAAAETLRDLYDLGTDPRNPASAPVGHDPRAAEVAAREAALSQREQQVVQQRKEAFVGEVNSKFLSGMENDVKAWIKGLKGAYTPAMTDKMTREIVQSTVLEMSKVKNNEIAFTDLVDAAARRGDPNVTVDYAYKAMRGRARPILQTKAAAVLKEYAEFMVGSNQIKRDRTANVTARKESGPGFQSSGEMVKAPQGVANSTRDVIYGALGLK